MSPPGDLAQLYERAGPLIYRRCQKMLQDHDEALDVTQWVFLRAIEVGFEPRDPAQSLTWLYKTATSRCLTLLRNRRTRDRIREHHRSAFVRFTPSAERETLHRDLLRRALARVDDRTGSIVLLTWMQGFSNQRAAELCDVSVRTVVRARKQFESVVNALEEEAPCP